MTIDTTAHTGNETKRNGWTPEEREAWITAFYIENHLDYAAYPDHVASPEQVRFMIYKDLDERYYPCSDEMYESIMARDRSKMIRRRYQEVLERILRLVAEKIEDPRERKYLEALIRIKYRHETRDQLMLSSRLEKRLLRIFLDRTQIGDPFAEIKAGRNRRVCDILNSPAFVQALNRIDVDELRTSAHTLDDIRNHLSRIELQRLLAMAVERRLWEDENAPEPVEEDFQRIFHRRIDGDGWPSLLRFLGFENDNPNGSPPRSRKILWLADESGEVIIDLKIIRSLVRMGHTIVVVLKDGPLYTKVDFQDAREDACLQGELDGAFRMEDPNMGKNDLVRTLRSDYQMYLASDGTRETMNLLLAATTFARLFKEVDAVVSRGKEQRRRFFETRFRFTRDIYSIVEGADESLSILYRPRHPDAIKFSHSDLESLAGKIIGKMRAAKKKGMTVIFYSGIIGSIPGKIATAKKIMRTFIAALEQESAMTFIINPSEYFEPGMDADDLMYMWEIVQRSGLIDIWRFQTSEDIEEAFRLMRSKIPPEWVGKDATYSTGCTKEMRIALDVQQKNPEMQIIGPARERFMRRNEYGIGSMYDQRLREASL